MVYVLKKEVPMSFDRAVEYMERTIQQARRFARHWTGSEHAGCSSTHAEDRTYVEGLCVSMPTN